MTTETEFRLRYDLTFREVEFLLAGRMLDYHKREKSLVRQMPLPWRSIRCSHNGIMLISVCRQRHVSQNLDKSLETQENCSIREMFHDWDMLTSLLNS